MAIRQQSPEGFESRFEIVIAFAEHGGKILLMRRQPWDIDGNLWDLPGGSIEPGETLPEAMVREFSEEAGVNLPEENFKFIKSIFVTRPQMNVTMHLFHKVH